MVHNYLKLIKLKFNHGGLTYTQHIKINTENWHA